ncbi:MAG: T9SS type A sorting domain-containing protein [Melioribacteraceae bacterium]|nr:T9SS type A sorting domain-containing protein [Melioribacteraceae bacterium]MCF8266162.1 T9SS type A sorting domain-containing protein [Melioribacteraceae bacterium]MCF8431645.1 T9SS type A sorting domain-containing protein [Melioribacteraceae bacterium]
MAVIMKSFITIIFLSFLSTFAQPNCNRYLPITLGDTLVYQAENWPILLYSAFTDTMTVNGNFYYKYYPNLKATHPNYSHFWLSPQTDNILLLDLRDSTSHVLFDFTTEEFEKWELPKTDSMGFNQCIWSKEIMLVSRNDSVQTNIRSFENCYKFTHLEKNCFDAGQANTIFAPDVGIVAFSEVTEGEVLDWVLITEPFDTVKINAEYNPIGNPCTTIPCLPGIVSAINCRDTNYVLLKNNRWYSDQFDWYGYSPWFGDSVSATGFISERTDINCNKYFTIELIDFKPLEITSINMTSKPEEFSLSQNYPNPFNPTTTIKYSIPTVINQLEFVVLRIYSALGIEVATLVNEMKYPGNYEVDFDASDLSSGVYFYKLRVGLHSAVRKMLVLK